MSRHELPVRRTIAVANPVGPAAALWGWSQRLGIVVFVAAAAALATVPGSIEVFWNVVVPLLPAVFLISPMIWRNVCPLATINRFTADRFTARLPTAQWLRWAPAAGIALLYSLVPARRFLLNHDAAALATLLAIVGILPVIGGLLFEGKSGFCNGVCPVLPVERLYGQQPLTEVTNARCAPCTRCTDSGCIDLAADKSIAQTFGKSRKSPRWVLTPFGLFVASFPGFVYGYFTAPEGSLSSAPAIYGHVFLWAAVSTTITVVIALALPRHSKQIALVSGAAAASAYYAFATPALARTLGLPPLGASALRGLALVLVAAWLVRGWLRTQRSAPRALA